MISKALIDAFTTKVRADADLATWLGDDTDGKVRFYWWETLPRLEKMFADPKAVGTADAPLRYGVWRAQPDTAPEWFPGGSRIERVRVEILLNDKSDGSAEAVTEGYGHLLAIFEPPANSKWEDITMDGARVMQVVRVDSGQGPEQDDSEEWFGSTMFELMIDYT